MRILKLLTATLIVLAAAGAGRDDPVPRVPFGHRRHVAKQITCGFCHSGATRQTRAGMPGVNLCMSCHSVVLPHDPGVLRAKAFKDRGEEIEWPRLNAFPAAAGVFFNHGRHAAAGIGCGKCHGPVDQMDVLRVEVRLTMSFCVTCHRETKTKFRDVLMADDCATCHR